MPATDADPIRRVIANLSRQFRADFMHGPEKELGSGMTQFGREEEPLDGFSVVFRDILSRIVLGPKIVLGLGEALRGDTTRRLQRLLQRHLFRNLTPSRDPSGHWHAARTDVVPIRQHLHRIYSIPNQ